MKKLLNFLVAMEILATAHDEALVDLRFEPNHNEYFVEAFDGEVWWEITNIWADFTDGDDNQYFAWCSDADGEFVKDILVIPNTLRVRDWESDECVYFGGQ
jgi:hypothetical protein